MQEIKLKEALQCKQQEALALARIKKQEVNAAEVKSLLAVENHHRENEIKGELCTAIGFVDNSLVNPLRIPLYIQPGN